MDEFRSGSWEIVCLFKEDGPRRTYLLAKELRSRSVRRRYASEPVSSTESMHAANTPKSSSAIRPSIWCFVLLKRIALPPF